MSNQRKHITGLTHSYHYADAMVRYIKDLDEYDVFVYVDEKSSHFLAQISKPSKKSLLHDILECEIGEVYESMIYKTPVESIKDIQATIEENNLIIPSWLNEDEISEHSTELYALLSTAIEREAQATFHLLFGNRNFLFEFQFIVARYIEKLKVLEHPEILKRDGVLKRCHIPEWLKTAVYHRDQGHCQLCWKNITGLLFPIKDYQLDHMIPLAESGSNDPTNFQLVCGSCNQNKGANSIVEPQKIITHW